MSADTSGVQIPYQTMHEVSRKGRNAALDAITMEWAADVARKDQRIAELEALVGHYEDRWAAREEDTDAGPEASADPA